MNKFVIKRNDDKVVYNPKKIEQAVYKSSKAKNLSEKNAIRLSKKIKKEAESKLESYFNSSNDNSIHVEDIQDIVEKLLMEENKKVAKRYIIYRYQREKARRNERKFDEAMHMMDGYLNRDEWKINENSNMGYSLQGLNNFISGEITEQYWLQELYPDDITEAHNNGDFHIHDLGMLSVYCCGWDLKDLLVEGFSGVEYKIESKPPNHLDSALMQSVNFLYTLQGESAGAQAFSNFDTLMAPFIRHDGLSYDEVYQCMQKFIFNINVPTRVGFQTPFTNISFDLTPPSNLKDEPVIVGGKEKNNTYGEYQKEMDMLNRAFAEVMLEGDAKGRVFSFPIPTYSITEDFEWDNKSVLDPVWEMTAKYGIPYFSNFINSDMSPEDTRSMCCRLRLDNTELRKRGGGLFGSNPLTGSIGVVTLNMARIGYKSKTKDEFIENVYRLMDVAKDSLVIKRKAIENYTEHDFLPYSKFWLRNVYDRFGKYWQNHFNTIGLNGMNEALLNLIGKNIATDDGIEFATIVLEKMRDKLVEYQEDTGHMFNLEATPAEGTSYRLAKIDKDKYGGNIIVANEKQVRTNNTEPYYTNSTQLPVGYTEDIFTALDLQDNLQTLYTGGTVFHGFLGERIPSVESTKKMVKTIAENYNLPYYTLTPTFSICPNHGYTAGEHYECPVCEEESEVWSRVVGFLTPVGQWNKGKQSEWQQREVFNV